MALPSSLKYDVILLVMLIARYEKQSSSNIPECQALPHWVRRPVAGA